MAAEVTDSRSPSGRTRAAATWTPTGEVERTRPIYPYPVVTRYSGTGNPKAEESFVPFDPTTR